MKYILYKDTKLRKGGRSIKKMSDKEFAEKAKSFILSNCSDYTKERIEKTENIGKIVRRLPEAIRQIYWNDKKAKNTIKKDFKGISPDWENFDVVGGIRHVKGAPYITMYIGGDWENPICVMVYHDGKEFRCYVPKKGNVYREDTKRLFGNNDETDDEYVFNQLVKQGDLKKEDKEKKCSGLSYNINYDLNSCIEDFSERVELKESVDNKRMYEMYDRIMLEVSKVVKESLDMI